MLYVTLISSSGFSQGEFNNWYFGDEAGITFNTIPPSPLTNCASSFFSLLNPGAISDSSGNLLFYANWTYVYNKNHQVMVNGAGLASDGSVDQQCFIMQSLSDDSLYYLFTMDSHLDPVFNPDAKGLCYSVVDMRLDGGLGGIVPGLKNVQIMGAGQTSDALTLTRHRNNRDAWIVVREYNNSNKFLAFKVTSSGINSLPVVSNSLITLNWTLGDGTELRHIKISPDGEKLVCVYEFAAEVCAFNSENGVIMPLFLFDSPSVFPLMDSQIEFSLNSRYLYAGYSTGSNNTSNIYQYDVSFTDSASFVQSAIQVGQTRDAMGFQRGPDGKIYVTVQLVDSVGVINFPNENGSGCDFHRHVIGLDGNLSYSGFPQFLQRYYLYLNYNGRCINDSVSFSHVVWPPVDSIFWTFGDPMSGSSDTSYMPEPSHTFSSPGDYTITLIVRHNDNRFDTAIQIIHIYDVPVPLLGIDQFICFGDSVTFDAGFCAGCMYQWDNIATSQTNIGHDQTLTVYDAGLYVVHVTNSGGCTGRDTVQVSLSPVPLLTTTPLSKSICSGDSTFIQLSSNVPAADFAWTASLTSGNVTGFIADSGIVINQILINNIASPGVVTYRITPRVGNCIGDTTDYAVTVDPSDTVDISITTTSNSVCAGTLVTFTAMPVNGGTTPLYQWQVNGVHVGTNPVFSYVPSSLDLVSCILTSSITTCISNNPDTSNVITMTVNPNLPVSISVTPSENPFCLGAPVTFTAAPVNEGSNPSYHWQVNGMDAGTNNPVYSYNPASGDLVSCILTSSEECTTNNPDTSAAVSMIGFPGLPADVTVAASPSPSCEGVSVTFTAAPINGGSNPSYQWQVNGNIVGSNNPAYTYIPAPLDLVSCIMTSNLACVTNNPATSILYSVSISPAPVVTFTPCFDTITTTNAKPIKLKGGIPLGGTYSGPGVSGGYFYPNLAGPGIHTITYAYVNASLCSASSISRFHNFAISPFVCGSDLTDIRDGKVYPTIQIGTQCWMAADLNYGIEIPPNIHQRENCINEKYFNPASSIQHPASVYQWDELMRYDPTPSTQGLCPPGWHVPTEAEWSTLFANWTNNAFAASPLKYSGYSGIDAFLSGARHNTVQWDYQDFATFFWSSTAYGPYKAWAHGMNDPDPSVSYYPSLRSNAFSVRCIRD